jgi:hypothetical protein
MFRFIVFTKCFGKEHFWNNAWFFLDIIFKIILDVILFEYFIR